MKKEELEKILDLSYPYLKEKASNLTLIDIFDIASKAWVDLQNEPKKNYDNVQYILFDRDQWSEFKYSGSLRIDIDDDRKLEFIYKPNAFRLESGEIIDSDTDPDEGEGLPEQFFDFDDCFEKSYDCEDDVPAIPLINSELDSKIITWIVDHIAQIQDVVGFDIKNLEKDKGMMDLYGEDSVGNGIIFYGDREDSTDKTLCQLLYWAIASDVGKVVWIANEVQEEHSYIINWLNEHHVGGIRFYLIEAKKITTPNNKTAATGFRVVEGPDTGQMDLV